MADATDVVMSTWEELRAHLTAEYSAEVTESGEIQVTMTEVPAPIDVRPIDVYGEPWVEVVATLAKSSDGVSPPAALSRSFQLAIGVFALRDGGLILRQLVPLDGLHEDHIGDVLMTMGQAINEARLEDRE
jgi:hypothetical protein